MTFREYYMINMDKGPYDLVTVVIGSDKKDGISIENTAYFQISNKYRYNKLLYTDGNLFVLSRNQEFKLEYNCTVSDIAHVLYNGINGEKIFYLHKGVRSIYSTNLLEMLSNYSSVYTMCDNVIVTMEEE